MEGRERSEGQSHKEEEREGGSGTGEEPLARNGGLYLDICRGAHEFLVTALQLMGRSAYSARAGLKGPFADA